MMKMIQLTIESDFIGGTLYCGSIAEALECLKADLENEDDFGDNLKVTIEVVEMTQKEIDALPEFEGW